MNEIDFQLHYEDLNQKGRGVLHINKRVKSLEQRVAMLELYIQHVADSRPKKRGRKPKLAVEA